jgi:hypothetical protein
VTVRLTAAGAARVRRSASLRATLTLHLTGGAIRTPAHATLTLRR